MEATTAAVAWVTPRDACCRRCRLALSLSAFTWKESSNETRDQQYCQYWCCSYCISSAKKANNLDHPISIILSISCSIFEVSIPVWIKKKKSFHNCCSPLKQQRAVLCWQLSHVNTPSTPQTSLCPAPPNQQHPWNYTMQNKRRVFTDCTYLNAKVKYIKKHKL